MRSNDSGGQLVGNRLVLVGAILYLLEWVAIIAAQVDAPFGPDTAPGKVLETYAGHADGLGWAAGWFSVVLLGRVLFVVGLRTGLVASGRPHPMMDLAVVAMAVGVAIEVATYGITTAAGLLADDRSGAGVLALDRAAFALNTMIFGPTGVAVLCAALAFWRSRLLPRALDAVGLLAGGVLTLAALALVAPRFTTLLDAATSVIVLVWVWMVWLGVLFWRRTPRRGRAGTAQPSAQRV